jgi:hypothetical protein
MKQRYHWGAILFSPWQGGRGEPLLKGARLAISGARLGGRGELGQVI